MSKLLVKIDKLTKGHVKIAIYMEVYRRSIGDLRNQTLKLRMIMMHECINIYYYIVHASKK